MEVAVPAPGVKEAGLKVAVAPGGKPVAANVTGALNPPVAFRLRVKVAAWPFTTVADPVGRDTTKSAGTGEPVAVNATFCGEFDALSAIDTFPGRGPVVLGEKVTLIEQLAPAARVAP